MEIQIGGFVFDDWKVVRKIGSGASGTVYEIRKEEYQGAALSAALKVLQIPEDPSAAASLRSDGLDEASLTSYLQKVVDELVGEIKIMISLKDFAYVVRCEDYKVLREPEAAHWTILIRMELLQSLADYQLTHDFTEADVHRMGVHLGKALALMEERHLIHRDIKPENIFVNAFGDFKLGDFGIARVYDQSTSNLSMKGTQSYMAPEMFRGEAYDQTVDIYSLGLVLYKSLNRNRQPFLPVEGYYSPLDRQNALAERVNGKKEIPPPVCGSPEFSGILRKMCAFRPEERYENAALLLRDLAELRPSDAVVLEASGDPASAGDQTERADTSPSGGQNSGASSSGVPAGGADPFSVTTGEAAFPPPVPPGPAETGETAEREKALQGKPEPDDPPVPETDTGKTRGPEGKKSPVGKIVLLAAALLVLLLAVLIPVRMFREYPLIVKSGSGSGSYRGGSVVAIAAEEIPGKRFAGWLASGLSLTIQEEAAGEITFAMPRHKVEITATYVDIDYTLTVNGGSGGGRYYFGDGVTVTADEPAEGFSFTGWTLVSGEAELDEDTSPTLEFTMPDGDVELTAGFKPLSYRLEVSGASGSGEYAFGEEITLTAEAADGASFTGWTVEAGPLELSAEDAAGPELIFSMPAGDLVLSAVFAEDLHEVTVTGGTGSGFYAAGETVSIAAEVPEEGMAFARWSMAGDGPALRDSEAAETTFVMPDRDVEVTARFEALTYALTVENASGSGTYSFGDAVQLEAEEREDYTFQRWSVREGTLEIDYNELRQRQLSFDMPACDLTIRAVYSVNEYDVTVTGGTGSGTYSVGETVDIGADEPAEGMAFSGWTVTKGEVSLEDPAQEMTSFVMPGQDVAVTARFEALTYTLTVVNAPGSGTCAFGDTVTLTAEEKEAQTFVRWEVVRGDIGVEESALTDSLLEFTMPACNVRIRAVYEKNTHSVTVTSGSGGGTYAVGDTVTITADKAPAGSRFSGWQITRGGASLADPAAASTTFVMPDQDVTAAAQYELLSYVLTVNDGTGGGTYHLGDAVSISAASSKDGLPFSHWSVDTGSLVFSDPGARNLTFQMPAEDLVLTAHFASPKRVVRVTNGRGSGMYTVGDEVTVTADASNARGQAFLNWTVEEGELDTEELDLTSTTLTFEMPDSALTLKANYSLAQAQTQTRPQTTGYTLTVNGGTGSGTYAAGSKVTVTAVSSNPGLSFAFWMVTGYTGSLDTTSATVEFTMPANNVILTAVFSN